MGAQYSVYLERCKTYESDRIKSFLDKHLLAQRPGGWHGCSVFLKPNLISLRNIRPACTDPRLILAVSEWFIGQGARLSLGDSPAFGKTSTVLGNMDILGELQKRSVKIVDFKRKIGKVLSSGVEVGVAAEPLEADYLVNLPKLKAHRQLYVTLGVKNIFGIVIGTQKAMLHMRHGGKDGLFAEMLLDLLELLPAGVTLLDGIEAMSRNGPLRGERLAFGLLGMATDPVALDTAILHALKLECEDSILWLEARRRELAGSIYENLQFPLLSPESFHSMKFEPPEEMMPIRFNPLHFLHGRLKRFWSDLR